MLVPFLLPSSAWLLQPAAPAWITSPPAGTSSTAAPQWPNSVPQGHIFSFGLFNMAPDFHMGWGEVMVNTGNLDMSNDDETDKTIELRSKRRLHSPNGHKLMRRSIDAVHGSSEEPKNYGLPDASAHADCSVEEGHEDLMSTIPATPANSFNEDD